MTNANDLKPGDSMMIDGHDWSWAFVVFKEIRDCPGYWVGTNGSLWSFRDNSGKIKSRCRRLHPAPTPAGHLKMSLTDRNMNRRLFYVHSLVLETFLGNRPEGLVCRHKDGKPGNNNIRNIHWGTVLDNIRDRHFVHNTTARGEAYPNSKLTGEKIHQIYDLCESGIPVNEIAERFGIDNSNCSSILKGKSWSHIATERRAPLKGVNARNKITDEDVRNIRKLYKFGGTTQKEIADQFGLKASTVSMIISRRLHPNIND